MVCRVLGELELHTGSGPVDLGGPLPRRLVCMLLVAEGQVVSDERLCQAVWGRRVPSKAVASLQAYVSRLRRAVGDQATCQVQRVGTGYRLRLAPGGTDVEQFVAGVREGRRLLAAGRPDDALLVLDGALALWRGEPFADLPDDSQAVDARMRLAELREVAVEERLAARLGTGDAGTAVAELEPAVRAAPFRERRWALLILGLYRCGRQHEALAALRRVRRLFADQLGIDPGPELQDLERRVLAQDPHLLLVSAAGAVLPADPARTTVAARPASPVLTRPLSAFVGRAAQLRLVSDLLAEHRLVTLVGPAGVGKSRLAVEYAAGRHDPDGPWLVRLADVAMDELPLAVATAVGLADVTGDRVSALVAALSARPGLLLLDNCEHLVAPVAELALDLLAGCPPLRILATSRQPLGVDGERTVPVTPLATRRADGDDGPAVELLLDRIHAIRPGWAPSDAERATVRGLCTALDGLPLALELAAARARVFGLQELADRLHDRFALLGPVPPGSLQPHATLAAAVAWSVDLLAGADRAMLTRLWPFDGGFSIEAAESVRPPAATAALESLSALVARSVVVADTTVTPSRYRLLETIRTYCRDHDQAPDASREAHARWVRDLAAWAIRELWRGEHAGHVIRVLRRELPNIRAGLAHDLDRRPPAALRTAGQLNWFWLRDGHLGEGQELTMAALRAAPDAPCLDRARAWATYASSLYFAGDLDGADTALAEARTVLGRPVDEQSTILNGLLLFYAGLIHSASGDPATGLREAKQVREIGRRTDEPCIVTAAEMAIGATLTALGRTGEGEQILARATTLAENAHQYWTAGMTELYLGSSLLQRAWQNKDVQPAEQALTVLGRAVRRFEREEDISTGLCALHAGALALALTGRLGQATQLRAAVHHHAVRYGLRPDRIHIYSAASETMLTQLLPPHSDAATTRAESEDLTWSDMLALLAT